MRKASLLLLVGLLAFTGIAVADEAAFTEAFVIAGSRVTPDYPPAARAARFTGTVTVAAMINDDGSVGASEVIDSSNPNLGFEDAALEAFTHWRFAPAVQDGAPVATVWSYQFHFEAPGGRLSSNAYVSGAHMMSSLAAPGSVKGGTFSSEEKNRLASVTRHGFAKPSREPCSQPKCMYDRTKLLPPTFQPAAPTGK